MPPYMDRRNISAGSKPKARLNRSMLSMLTLRSPRSTDPTYVLCSPERSAKASCESPRTSRSRLRFVANAFRAEKFCAFFIETNDFALMTMRRQTISSDRIHRDSPYAAKRDTIFESSGEPTRCTAR
jgi:hypothetical protein